MEEAKNACAPALAMSDMFFKAFASLPAKARQKTQAFLMKFRRTSASNGINFEKIQDAARPGYFSARVDDNYRAIVCRPEAASGNVFLLLWVDEHEKAYRWARTHVCEMNAVTGAMQVYATTETEAPESGKTPVSESKKGAAAPKAKGKAPEKACVPEKKAPPLFERFSKDELLSVGVPENRLELVAGLDSREALETAREQLPVDAFESLVWLAEGDSLESVLEAYGPNAKGSMEESLKSKRTGRGFLVIETDEDMARVTGASLERWRVFLHPLQKKIVATEKNFPMLVRGAAGTGKTVVALHRAVELVSRADWDPEKTLLFTTYTKNLAVDIESMLKTLTSDRPDLMRRIEVTNLDAWVANFLRRCEVGTRIIYPANPAYREAWQAALYSKDEKLPLDDSFYEEEWRRVVLPQEIAKEADYLRAPRKGRGVSLSRLQRKKAWPVFENMRYELSRRGAMTIEDACFAAARLVDSQRGILNYGAVIVDEAQDMGTESLKLLAKIATIPGEEEPRILLAGDGQQRIYARTASLMECGINVRGRRSTRLRLTYRTTEEIREAANRVLAGAEFDNMDEGAESRAGDTSNRHGHAPVLFAGKSLEEEAAWIAERIRDLQGERVCEKLRDICVVTRTQDDLEHYAKALEALGVRGEKISRNKADAEGEGIRFGTMHRVKGLEFKAVFIAGAGRGQIPFEAYRTNDAAEKRMNDLTERSLFYVAASRAKDALFVSCAGDPGAFLQALMGKA